MKAQNNKTDLRSSYGEIENIIKLPLTQRYRSHRVSKAVLHVFKECIIVLFTLFQNREKEEILPDDFSKARITIMPKLDKEQLKTLNKPLL